MASFPSWNKKNWSFGKFQAIYLNEKKKKKIEILFTCCSESVWFYNFFKYLNSIYKYNLITIHLWNSRKNSFATFSRIIRILFFQKQKMSFGKCQGIFLIISKKMLVFAMFSLEVLILYENKA